jgi:DNA-binding protein HU-beta
VEIVVSQVHRANGLVTTYQVDEMNLQYRKEIFMSTTNEIADKIATEHGLTKVQSKTIVEAVFAAITSTATSGAETSIPGFGKFKVKDTPERDARNPSTGATIKVPAARKLSFQPAKALKDALNK